MRCDWRSVEEDVRYVLSYTDVQVYSSALVLGEQIICSRPE